MSFFPEVSARLFLLCWSFQASKTSAASYQLLETSHEPIDRTMGSSIAYRPRLSGSHMPGVALQVLHREASRFKFGSVINGKSKCLLGWQRHADRQQDDLHQLPHNNTSSISNVELEYSHSVFTHDGIGRLCVVGEGRLDGLRVELDAEPFALTFAEGRKKRMISP